MTQHCVLTLCGKIASYYYDIPRFNQQNLLQPSKDDFLKDILSPEVYNLVIH